MLQDKALAKLEAAGGAAFVPHLKGVLNRGRKGMTSFRTVTEDDLGGAAVEDGGEADDGGIEADHVDEAQNPFAHFLRNLLSGGGRTRRERIISGDGDNNDPSVTEGKLCNQDFYELRQQCLDAGELFVDPEFPPDDQSLYFSQDPPFAFEWRRASEIAGEGEARLFMDGASRFDINQGELGDCWLLAALANLTMNKRLLYKVVPKDQSFQEEYAGIFHFRFWQYGEWVDVVIDDYLPTRHGQLMFMHSDSAAEFWTALVEKAYAKLHGSYEALKGGTTTEAMVDFTGGCTELYDLKDEAECPGDVFTLMHKAYQRSSMEGCSLTPDPDVTEAKTDVGLIRGHAYSITKVMKAQIETPNVSGRIPLVRIRNPWGNEAEWTGAWSDGSAEWQFIPDEEKEAMGLNFDSDGEFWMSYRDFIKHFDQLEICNLTPDALHEDEEEDDGSAPKWQVGMFNGSWIPGETAGGCRNNLETFAMNPQYRINVTDPDDDDDDNLCTVIISLMQKGRRAMRDEGLDTLTIGFALYYLRDPEGAPRPLDTDFFRYNRSVGRSKAFINLREVSCRFRLPPGCYVIVPSTFSPDEEGDYILRVFTEKESNPEES